MHAVTKDHTHERSSSDATSIAGNELKSITDDCGNTTTQSATVTIEDNTAPAIDTQASDITVECDGFGNDAQLQAWLAANGNAVSSDDCSSVTWTNNYTTLSNDCGATGSATVTFTATDATRIAVGAKPYLLMIVGGASILITYLPRILCECYYRTLNRNVVCAAAMAQITADILAFAAKATIKTFRVFVDTGCSISIINDKSRLVNVKKIRPITVNGIAGAREINMAGDLMLRVVDNEGVNRTIVVNNVTT